MRRANIPVDLTEGFHPKPKLSFAAPLAVGITSQGSTVMYSSGKPCLPRSFAAS